MIKCSDFPQGSRKWAICNGMIDWPLEKINSYRKQYGEEPLTEKPESTYLSTPAKEYGEPTSRRPVRKTRTNNSYAIIKGGPGSELMAIMEAMEVPSCQQCKDLAKQMDEWGVAGCRTNFEFIVSDIMPRARKWVDKEYPFVSKLFPNLIKDIPIDIEVRSYVTQAIDTAEAKKKRESDAEEEKASSTMLWEVDDVFAIQTAH